FILNQAFVSGIGIANITYTLDLAPSKSRPTYLGFINTLLFPVSFVPMLAGYLIKIVSYEVMFLISACVSAIALYFASKLSNNYKSV
ncbi:MAG: MFS transporter, partial [bacterium]